MGSCASIAHIKLPGLAAAMPQRPPAVGCRLAPKMWICELLHAGRALRAAMMSFSERDTTTGTPTKIRRHSGDTRDGPDVSTTTLRRHFERVGDAQKLGSCG